MRNEPWEAVSRDERVLTLQKTLEQKQQERLKLKTEKNSMKKKEQVLPLTVKTTLNKKVRTHSMCHKFSLITLQMFNIVTFCH